MSSFVNPRTSRLGISQFSFTNYLPIIKSNYRTLEKYKYQNYIQSLEHFCQIYFHSKFRIFFYTRLYTLYSNLKFNTFGFPGTHNLTPHTNIQHFRLDIKLYDYYMHVYGGMSLRVILENYVQPLISKAMDRIHSSRKALIDRRRFRDRFDTSKIKGNIEDSFNFNINYNVHKKTLSTLRKKLFYTQGLLRSNIQIKRIISFIKRFVWCLNVLRRHVNNYLIKLKLFFKYTHFKYRISRLHNYFFPDIPLKCGINIVPFQGKVTARFLCFFIERRVRAGMHLPKVINLIFRFLKRNKSVRGLRIICSGRFKRGNKAGFYHRLKGSCTYGSIDTFNQKYELDYSELKMILRAGTCGIRVWVCFWSKRLTHLFDKESASPYGYIKPRRSPLSRRHHSRERFIYPALGH